MKFRNFLFDSGAGAGSGNTNNTENNNNNPGAQADTVVPGNNNNQNSNSDNGQKLFSADYVHTLREENKSYRLSFQTTQAENTTLKQKVETLEKELNGIYKDTVDDILKNIPEL